MKIRLRIRKKPSKRKVVIRDIKIGEGYRQKWIYARLYDVNGEGLIISAELEYILTSCILRKDSWDTINLYDAFVALTAHYRKLNNT